MNRPTHIPPSGAALDRAIGRWSLTALTFNCVVGAGILGLPGRVFALSGPATIWVIAGAASLALAAAFCLADLASRFEGAGGPVEYCREAFGEGVGFAIGWLLWTAIVLAGASLLNLLADLANVSDIWRDPLIISVGIALTGFAMLGAGRSAAGSAALTIIKLSLLALLWQVVG